MNKKHIPMRICVGCESLKPKHEMLRIVLDKQDNIQIDKNKKLSGRGAYICANEECFEKAYNAKRLERSLKHRVNITVYEGLKEEIKNAK